MPSSLTGQDFLKDQDFDAGDINHIHELAKGLKKCKQEGIPHKRFDEKNIVLLFQKTSTRTRCAFEVAGRDLGMGVTYLDPKSSQMGEKESMEDTARVLSRFYDGIEFRGYAHEDVERLAEYATVPVWNGLSDKWHPTQTLADMLTIKEEFRWNLQGKTLVFMGDASNNVARSLMVSCATMGVNYVACCPETNEPGQDVVDIATPIAQNSGSTIKITDDVDEAVRGANVVYTDVWVSMGEHEDVWEERIHNLEPYRVTREVMEKAGSGAIFMHCLPSFHDTNTVIGAKVAEKFGVKEMEVTDEVFRGPQSRVFEQAENRMHTIKAMMMATLG